MAQTLRSCHLHNRASPLLRPSPLPPQVEEACNLGWFLSDECFAELKERSKDTRGVALPNFMSSDAFCSVFTARECLLACCRVCMQQMHWCGHACCWG